MSRAFHLPTGIRSTGRTCLRSSAGCFAFFLAVGLAAPATVTADSIELDTTGRPPAVRQEHRNYFNFRVGPATFGGAVQGRPTLCLEVAPLRFASLEACGNGSGFLHQDPVPELAHFRSLWRVASWMAGDWQVRSRLGIGFAELQIGRDTPGFHFSGVDAARQETSGPEGVASLQAVYALGAGFDFVGEAHAGGAYLPNAPRLARPMAATQTFAGLTLGVGW